MQLFHLQSLSSWTRINEIRSTMLLCARNLTLLHIRGLVLLPINTRRANASSPTEVDPLCELPDFNASEEQHRRNDNDCPLPSNHLMLENHSVDHRNIESREDSDETKDDSPEEELVAAYIVDPVDSSVHNTC